MTKPPLAPARLPRASGVLLHPTSLPGRFGVGDLGPGTAWFDWEPGLARRDPRSLALWRGKLAEPVRYVQFVQYAFAVQWQAVREACRARGVRIFGDLPIFVALDSADVWARPDLFCL